MRGKLIVPIAIAAALACTAIAAALVGTVAGATGADHPRVLKLLAVTEGSTSIDKTAENDPPTLGARFVWRVGLYNWAGSKRGARVGRVVAFCTFVGRSPEEAYCNAGFFLPAGQILAVGFYRYSEGEGRPTSVPVIGGTGAYAGARGFVKARSVGPEEAETSAVELHLLP